MKILLVRVSSLGDVLHNLPMVADILRHHPQATIDWVVEEGYVSLVRLNPKVRKIIPFALRRWRKGLRNPSVRAEIKAFVRTLREEEYDLVFDTQGLLKTGIVMGAARVKRGGRKVGLANGSEGSGYEGISRLFHTQSIPLDPRTHAVARGRLVAGAALGYAVDTPPDFGLPAPDPALRPDWRRRRRTPSSSMVPRATPRSGRAPTGSPPAMRWRRCRCCCPGVPRARSATPSTWPRSCRTHACCRNYR